MNLFLNGNGLEVELASHRETWLLEMLKSLKVNIISAKAYDNKLKLIQS